LVRKSQIPKNPAHLPPLFTGNRHRSSAMVFPYPLLSALRQYQSLPRHPRSSQGKRPPSPAPAAPQPPSPCRTSTSATDTPPPCLQSNLAPAVHACVDTSYPARKASRPHSQGTPLPHSPPLPSPHPMPEPRSPHTTEPTAPLCLLRPATSTISTRHEMLRVSSEAHVQQL
jgi:hypothetical protein